MRRFVIAVSLAHALLLSLYVKLGAIRPWHAAQYLFGSGFLWVVMLVSAVAAPFIIGGIFWGLDALLRRGSTRWLNRVRESVFVLLCVVAGCALVNAILLADQEVERILRDPLVDFINRHVVGAVSVGAVVGIALLVLNMTVARVREGLVRVLSVALCIISPSVLLSIAGVGYLAMTVSPAEHTIAAISDVGPTNIRPGFPKNIVIVLFDGFSYVAAFDDKEISKRLPALRALGEESIVFHDMQSFPGGTQTNVASLLTGQVYEQGLRLHHQRGDIVALPDGTEIVLRDRRNLFDLGHEHGYRTVVLGTAVRYCNTYVKGRGSCRSNPFDLSTQPDTVAEAVFEPYRFAFGSMVPYNVQKRLFPKLDAKDMRASWTVEMHRAVLQAIDGTQGVFVYAHYPVPHPPYVRYDARTKVLLPSRTYFDSLQVVDQLFKELRAALQASNTWEDTLVVVLSDHQRSGETRDVRVPLFIKLPHASGRVDYDGRWTHAQFMPLLEELFKGGSFDSKVTMAAVQALTPPS